MNDSGYASAFRQSLAVMLIAFALALPAATVDYAPILSDYAASLRAGNGLVFNSGERVLIEFTPLPMLLAAVLPAGILITLATALMAGSAYRIARLAGDNPLWALGATLLTTLFSVLALPVWAMSQDASSLMAALIVFGLELTLREKWRWAGLIFALAALCRLEALVPGLAALLLAATRGRAPRFALGWFAPLIAALAAMIAYYGPDFWEGLVGARLTFTAASGPAALLSGGTSILLVRCVWDSEHRLAVIGALGVGLYMVALALTGQAAVLIASIPLLAPALLLVWLWTRAWRLPRLVLAAGSAVALLATLLGVFRTPSPRPALVSDVQSGAFVSRAQALVIDRTPGQTLIALDGAFQPELRRMVERGDRRSILIRYMPDLLQNEERDFQWAPDADLQRLGYVSLGSESPALWAGAWKRTAPVGPFEEHAVSADFGPDVYLTGFALDAANAQPGGFFRLRLDWHLARTATRSLFPELWLVRDDTVIVLQRDEIEPSVLRAGPWSTYHGVTIPAEVLPGEYTLELAVVINNGTAGAARLGEIRIGER